MTSPMGADHRGPSSSASAPSDTEWSELAAQVGAKGASLDEAIASLADEQETFTSARSWRDLVERINTREDAFGRPGGEATPYPLLSVCPTRGGRHDSLPPEDHDQVLRRTTLGEKQLEILPAQAVAIVRNCSGAVWTVDLRSDTWGQMMWGVSTPAPKYTIAVQVSGTYLLIQRLEPFFPFQMELEIYTHAGCKRGKFRNLGTIPGRLLLDSGDVVDSPVPVSVVGDLMVVLRQDTELALFQLDTCQVIKTTPLPEEVQCALRAQEEDRCQPPAPICFDGVNTVFIAVPGSVLGVDLQAGKVSWRLSDLLPHLVLLQVKSVPARDVRAMHPVHLEPAHFSPQELIGAASMQVQRDDDGASVVLCTASVLIFVPDLAEQRGWMVALPAGWAPPPRPQPAFHGPSAARGCGLSVAHARVLWTTHLAPLLLDFSPVSTSARGPGSDVGEAGADVGRRPRAWDLWCGAGSGKEKGGYEGATTSLVRAMAQHQDWCPQACLTRSGAYLLGTLRGTAPGPDDPLPQSSQIVVWEFGTTALARLGHATRRQRRSACAVDVPRPPRKRVRRRSRVRERPTSGADESPPSLAKKHATS